MKTLLRSRLALILLCITALIVGVLMYTQWERKQPLQYRSQAVTQGHISQTVSANGTINPVILVSVGTQVSGTVKQLYVDYNSIVKKGQILLELDDALLAAQQKQSSANMRSAQAGLELANSNEARMRTLYAQDYVSRQELDTAVQAKKSATAQLQLAQATVEKDRATLAYSVIRSPVSGVVVDRSVDVGQTVAASLQTPTLFKIAQDLAQMQIDANFAEADIGNIRVGQAARFSVDAFPNRDFNGEVKLIRLNPTTQQNVVTYDVVINVDNPEKILLPGMTAYVTIVVAERQNALLVSNAALRYKPADDAQQPAAKKTEKAPESAGQTAFAAGNSTSQSEQETLHNNFSGRVYLLVKGKPQAVDVSLGITDNRDTEIVAGNLNAGDQVVLGETRLGSDAAAGKSSPRRMRLF